MNPKRAVRTTDVYLLEFYMMRLMAEARMIMGCGFPGEFVSVLRMQNAALAKNERTLVLASVRSTLAFPEVSAHVRRLFGSRGQATRQDALVAADIDAASEAEDFEAWAAYRRATRAKKNGNGNGDTRKKEKRKSFEGHRTPNAFNRKTGERNRCYTCNSEYHYAPQWSSSTFSECEEISQSTVFLYCNGNYHGCTANSAIGLRRTGAPPWTFFLDDLGN